MNQSKSESFVEACLNTASGFVVSLLAWRWIVAPLMGLPLDMQSNLIITGIFTVISIVRSYIWRRFFNKGLNRHILRLLK